MMTVKINHTSNRRSLRRIVLAASALLLPLWAAVADANTLKDIKVSTLPGDKLQLRLEMDAPDCQS